MSSSRLSSCLPTPAKHGRPLVTLVRNEQLKVCKCHIFAIQSSTGKLVNPDLELAGESISFKGSWYIKARRSRCYMTQQQQRRHSLPIYTACNRQLTLALNPPEAHTVQGRHQSQALLAAAHRGTPHHLSGDRSHSCPLSKEVGRFGQVS